ncbi:MAG: Uma2 family endonuclease [Planctomycetota bacterium]
MSDVSSDDGLVLLRDVSWSTYAELREQPANDRVQMVFDKGNLYLMSPGKLHERIAELLGQFVYAWTDARRIARLSGGSTTIKDALRDRGLEPDKCFYIQNEPAVRSKDTYDPAVDPPPDLVIEVDVTSISKVKLPIYADFGVPEIWRWVEEELEVYRLKNGAYEPAKASNCLPNFPIEQALAIVRERHQLDETTLVAKFRESFSADGGEDCLIADRDKN